MLRHYNRTLENRKGAQQLTNLRKLTKHGQHCNEEHLQQSRKCYYPELDAPDVRSLRKKEKRQHASIKIITRNSEEQGTS